MKKIVKRLELHRETLHSLTPMRLGRAAGGRVGTFNCTNLICHTDLCNTNTSNPIDPGSANCATGGACTTGTIPTNFGWTCGC